MRLSEDFLTFNFQLTNYHLLCLRPVGAEALSDTFVWRLSVAYIGCNSRTERPRKTKIGTEIAHVTWLGNHALSSSKGKGHQAAVLTAALTREAGAMVTMITYWAWETTATLRLLGARGVGAHGEERGGAYRVAARTAGFICHCIIVPNYAIISTNN